MLSGMGCARSRSIPLPPMRPAILGPAWRTLVGQLESTRTGHVPTLELRSDLSPRRESKALLKRGPADGVLELVHVPVERHHVAFVGRTMTPGVDVRGDHPCPVGTERLEGRRHPRLRGDDFAAPAPRRNTGLRPNPSPARLTDDFGKQRAA